MWIRDVILGAARRIQAMGLPMIDRVTLNFGSGFVVVDEPLQLRTTVTAGGGGSFDDLEVNTLTVNEAATIAEADIDDLLVNTSMQCDGSALFTGGAGVTAESFKLRSDVDELRVARAAPMYVSGDWSVDADGIATNAIVGRHVGWELVAPDGALLQTISVLVVGGAGHIGMPEDPPRLSLRKEILASGAVSEVDVSVDNSSTFGDLELAHVVELDLTGGDPDSGVLVKASEERYVIRLTAEDGDGSVVGDVAHPPYVTYRRLAGSYVGLD